MAGFGQLDGIHGEGTNGVGHALLLGLAGGRQGGLHRSGLAVHALVPVAVGER